METKVKGAVDVALIVLVAVVGAVFVAPAPKATGPVWYAPKTWFSNKPVQAFDKAKEDADKAKLAQDAAKAAEEAKSKALLHASHIEALKTKVALESAGNSKPVEVASRTINNATSGLGQLDNVTAAEMQDIISLVKVLIKEEKDMTAAERERANLAEAKQRAAEKALSVVSLELEKAKLVVAEKAKEVEATTKQVAVVANKLEGAYVEKTGLLNAYEAQSARHIILVIVGLVLLSLVVYCRMCLGGVGASLHRAGVPDSVVTELDSELGKLGQFMIRTGRVAASIKEHKASVLNPTKTKP